MKENKGTVFGELVGTYIKREQSLAFKEVLSKFLCPCITFIDTDPLLQIAYRAWQLLCHPSPPARLSSLLTQLSASCGSLDAIVKFKIDFQLMVSCLTISFQSRKLYYGHRSLVRYFYADERS